MNSHDSSLQRNNPANSALDSVEKLHRAVSSAMSHPTEQLIQQAENSLSHAERAVAQLTDEGNPNSVELAEELLGEEKERLSELHSKR
ncbi:MULTISPECIES: hypothetical protein [Paenibacillus]|uniref:DUF3813 family protein n=1 Tax=Paenibacillus campinasensis TaxID=66347 RepID=A0A268F0N7_9BACL|nr:MULTISPECIES: hypothetical protein [Paenibacillus]MUG65587.1 hypothetical protein [Paenibacillus campinasensis]PAD78946.1 hypothetical protein CHH67_05385 [Paenibacillus campinasensis]PAK53950.1 hypothetical protein CHH75_08570 [Paenibacillus sp. 7541]